MERSRSVEKESRSPSGAAVMRSGVTDALTRAFFAEWARVGFADLSLERVARDAGSGKAALYRRWPNKVTMAADLLGQTGLTITEVEDQGSFEADVTALLFAIRRVLRHPIARRIIADLHAELGRNALLAEAVRPFQDARRARARAIVDRAIVRADLPATVDFELLADLIGSPLYWRVVVLGRPVNRQWIARLARTIAVAARGATDERAGRAGG